MDCSLRRKKPSFRVERALSVVPAEMHCLNNIAETHMAFRHVPDPRFPIKPGAESHANRTRSLKGLTHQRVFLLNYHANLLRARVESMAKKPTSMP